MTHCAVGQNRTVRASHLPTGRIKREVAAVEHHPRIFVAHFANEADLVEVVTVFDLFPALVHKKARRLVKACKKK